ncbi:MAG: alpha/beta fold hydrolase [Rubrivivax sp.]
MAGYRAPWWLPGGNLQTIWAATLSQRHLGTPPQFSRERWETPDGDFIDVDHLEPLDGLGPAEQQVVPGVRSAVQPRHLLMFHGLEGSSASAYAAAFASIARQRGWSFSVPHFRGCSGTVNRAPRAYHSGDFEEVGWILQRHRAAASAPLLAVGISLGGNALLRWVEEAGASAAATVAAAAAVCAPLDLSASGAAIDRGFNGAVYARMFLRTMKPRALAKLQQYPGLFDRQRLLAARSLFEFDDVFTAPLHGFSGTADYWKRASAKPHLHRVRIPTLVLNARNDPFVPAESLPDDRQVGRDVTLRQPASGGHVGFPRGRLPPGDVLAMPQAVLQWLSERL